MVSISIYHVCVCMYVRLHMQKFTIIVRIQVVYVCMRVLVCMHMPAYKSICVSL